MGVPKAWIPFDAEPMLQRIVRILSQELSPVIAVAAAEQELPRLPPRVKVIRDGKPDSGPLQAIADALIALRGKADVAFVTGCDSPLLSSPFYCRVLALLEASDKLIAAPKVDGQFHPLAAAYRLDALAPIESMLSAGRLRVTDLLDEAPTRTITAAELRAVDPDLHSLVNVNTPDELRAAEKLAKRN